MAFSSRQSTGKRSFIRSVLNLGKCDEFGCPMSQVPPVGHLVIAGAVVIVLTVLVGALFARSRR